MISLKSKKELTKKERRANINKIKSRGRNYKDKYGISIARYNQLYKKQGGKCACCNSTTSNKNRPGIHFMVDHDHDGDIQTEDGIVFAGSVRGLLCYTCNLMLGFAKNDPERLIQAAEYLKKDMKKYVNRCPGFIISTEVRPDDTYRPRKYYKVNGVTLKHNNNQKKRVVFVQELITQ